MATHKFPQVDLTLDEVLLCAQVAAQRMVTAGKRALVNDRSVSRTILERLQQETMGAMGEMGYAKIHDIFYAPKLNTFHTIPDALNDVEIRTIGDVAHSLIVRDNDADERLFTLMLLDNMTIMEVGSMRGSDAKQSKYRKNPGGKRIAWFVPLDEVIAYGLSDTRKA